jgi:pilus assembly protein FimV
MLGALGTVHVALAALLLVPIAAQAQGLGRLTVHSTLGQPLRAEVPIISGAPQRDSGYLVRIASPDTYRAKGIEFDPVLHSVRVTVENRGGAMVVVLTSARPIKEPYIDVLLELETASGRLIRDYIILLESP